MILQIKTFQIESAVSGLINYKGDLYTCNFASIIFKLIVYLSLWNSLDILNINE